VSLIDQAQFEQLDRLLSSLIPNTTASPTDYSLRKASVMLSAELYNPARYFARSARDASPTATADAERFLGHIDVIEGVVSDNRGLIGRGRDQYVQLFETDPSDYASANNAIWITLSQLNDKHTALQIASRVAQVVPVEQMPEQLITTLTNLYINTEQLTAARDLLVAAVRANPHVGRFRYRLAEVYAVSDEPSKSLTALAEAFESSQSDQIDADAAEMLYHISRELCRKQHPPDTGMLMARACLSAQLVRSAELWAQNARQIAAKQQLPAIDHLLGDIALVDGISHSNRERLQDAAGWYQSAFDQNGDDWVAANNLISLQSRQLDDSIEATRIVEQILANHPITVLPVKIVETITTALRRGGQNGRAAAVLDRALNERPDVPEFHLQMALTHLAEGNEPMAQIALDQSVRLGLPASRLQSMAQFTTGTDVRPKVKKVSAQTSQPIESR